MIELIRKGGGTVISVSATVSERQAERNASSTKYNFCF